MALKKISAADFAIIGSGESYYEACKGTIHYTMEDCSAQGFIGRLLLRGESNSISTADLSALTGLDARSIRRQIENERRAGILILSGRNGGYFLPAEGKAGQQEIRAFYWRNRVRALSLLRTLRPFKKALSIIEGQQVIEE